MKTQDEIDRGIAFMIDSWESMLEQVGHDVVVAVRRAIWERHGNATEWAVRVVDDFRAGLINDVCSYCSVHRPATHDDVVASIMVAYGRSEGRKLHSWTSDFAKAYRQVPQLMSQLPLTVVVQWCPVMSKPVFILSAGQLFGGKTPPQNFSRHPAWWCYLMAPMYGLPLQHTVDDVMATESDDIAHSGNKAWRETIDLAGWDIPDSKSPTPSRNTCLLGADVRHDWSGSVLDITEIRADTLVQMISEHMNSDQLTAGAAAKLYGRLSATSSQTNGKYGRAKLGPIKSRQYGHHHKSLTRQLRVALLWWFEALRNRAPRPVPLERARRSNPVITYSDGEGASGGVGVVILETSQMATNQGLYIWKYPTG